jgi:hypothetical protein
MAVLHVHEAASPPPRAPSLHGGACGMHDKIACAKRNNTKYQRKSIYIALQPRELARQPATMRAWRASYFNSLCGVAYKRTGSTAINRRTYFLSENGNLGVYRKPPKLLRIRPPFRNPEKQKTDPQYCNTS